MAGAGHQRGSPDFYPRSPRGERPIKFYKIVFLSIFLSTLPARGATMVCRQRRRAGQHFYPRSPRGERRTVRRPPSSRTDNFYPRSPRGERRCPATPTSNSKGFLSTLPARGATLTKSRPRWTLRPISIHAPREGSDNAGRMDSYHAAEFLSTLPARGATQERFVQEYLVDLFLSTLPARGATRCPAASARA